MDRCGCKGMAVGDAVVSDSHANFVLNRGRATGGDVLSLLRACRLRVFERTGVLLEPEVRFWDGNILGMRSLPWMWGTNLTGLVLAGKLFVEGAVFCVG